MSAFLIVEFRDGSRISGVFAEGSDAITSPQRHGLFLEKEWTTDSEGNVQYEVPNSAGVVIFDTEDIRAVRILETKEAFDERP